MTPTAQLFQFLLDVRQLAATPAEQMPEYLKAENKDSERREH
jgi:hypothetical protein